MASYIVQLYQARKTDIVIFFYLTNDSHVETSVSWYYGSRLEPPYTKVLWCTEGFRDNLFHNLFVMEYLADISEPHASSLEKWQDIHVR